MDSILHATFMDCNHDVYQQDVYLPDNCSMATDYDRLLLAAEKMKRWLSPSEIALGLTRGGYEVTPQILTNWKTRGVSEKGLLKASPIIGCRPHWIETGEGPMEDRPDNAGLTSNVEPGPNISGMVPLISWVQAGDFCAAPDLFAPGDAEDWVPCIQKLGPHAYSLRVKGDSMTAPYGRSYPEGCLIFVDPDCPITNGCRVIAKLADTDEATFKVYVEDAGKKYLKPLNPQYPTIEINDSMMLCGVVKGYYMPE